MADILRSPENLVFFCYVSCKNCRDSKFKLLQMR